jgi:hypothetical protein
MDLDMDPEQRDGQYLQDVMRHDDRRAISPRVGRHLTLTDRVQGGWMDGERRGGSEFSSFASLRCFSVRSSPVLDGRRRRFSFSYFFFTDDLMT